MALPSALNLRAVHLSPMTHRHYCHHQHVVEDVVDHAIVANPSAPRGGLTGRFDGANRPRIARKFADASLDTSPVLVRKLP